MKQCRIIQRLKTATDNSKQINNLLKCGRKVPLYVIQESGLLYHFPPFTWKAGQRTVWLFLITPRCSCPRLSESSFGAPFSHQREREAVLVFVPVLVNEDTAAPKRTGYPAVSESFSLCQAIPTSLTPLSRHHDRRIPLFFLGGTKTKQAAAVQNKSSTAPWSVIRPSVPRRINPDDFRIAALSAQCKHAPQTNTQTQDREWHQLCASESVQGSGSGLEQQRGFGVRKALCPSLPPTVNFPLSDWSPRASFLPKAVNVTYVMLSSPCTSRSLSSIAWF